jgi:hypothetical protein
MLALDLFPKIDFPVVNITTKLIIATKITTTKIITAKLIIATKIITTKTDTIEETVNTINVR